MIDNFNRFKNPFIILEERVNLSYFFLSISSGLYSIQEAKKIGCGGYVLKSSGQKDLEKALDVVGNGGIFYVKG